MAPLFVMQYYYQNPKGDVNRMLFRRIFVGAVFTLVGAWMIAIHSTPATVAFGLKAADGRVALAGALLIWGGYILAALACFGIGLTLLGSTHPGIRAYIKYVLFDGPNPSQRTNAEP